MSKKIGIDIDEVLAECADALLAFHNYTINGISFHKSDITDYNRSKIPSLQMPIEQGKELFFRFFSNPERETIQPVVGAKEKLQNFKNSGYELRAITARRDIFREYTQNRMNKRYPDVFTDILYANEYSDFPTPKSQLCHQVGIVHMVEDNLDYARELATQGIKTILLDKPRNQGYDPIQDSLITKVKNWSEISEEMFY